MHTRRLYTCKLAHVLFQHNLENNPWFITGFADAEGCFLINVVKHTNLKTGWQIQLVFRISLHIKDKALLEQIQIYFKVSWVAKEGSKAYKYSVTSRKEFQVIIDHFDNYPLKTHKFADYEIWKQIFYLMLKE